MGLDCKEYECLFRDREKDECSVLGGKPGPCPLEQVSPVPEFRRGDKKPPIKCYTCCKTGICFELEGQYLCGSCYDLAKLVVDRMAVGLNVEMLEGCK